MTKSYPIAKFIEDVLAIVREASDESEIIAKVKPLAIQAAAETDWRKDEMYTADPELGYGTTLLHAEPDHSLFVVVDGWLPGRGVPPHNHGTWAVVVGVTGTERNTLWKRKEGGDNDADTVELEKISEHLIGEGEAITMQTGETHSVKNETDEVTLSFHVYGRHLNHTGRSQFDLELKIEKPFVIEAR